MELEHLLQKNAAIRKELASEDPVLDQEISPEWYQQCDIYRYGNTMTFDTAGRECSVVT